MGVSRRPLLLALGGVWALIWLVAGIPIKGLHPHPHFWRVHWIPFEFVPVRDALLNFAFYIPLGIIACRMLGSARKTLFLAFVLSSVTEAVQTFTVTRLPSTTDVILNVSGAAVGVWLAYEKPQAKPDQATTF
jgi:glycopeptide antibiotics resistance protein